MHNDHDGLKSPDEPSEAGNKDSSPIAHLSLLQHEIADLARFRAIMDCCDDVIFVIDARNGRIVDASGSACRRLGYDRDALLCLNIGDILDVAALGATDSLHTGPSGHADCVTILRGRGDIRLPAEIVFNAAKVEESSLIVAVARAVAGRRQEEEKLRAELKEKEVMLKEIHHRVKNNLQVISSLLSIQSTILADPRDATYFQESRDRIRTMALVHEKLYQSDDIAAVDFGPYVDRLTANLFRSYTGSGGRASLYVDVKDIFLGPDHAIPCGLIVNELVTNALKYAFPEGRSGTITVTMRQSDDRYELTVSDNGVGMPANFNLEETESLGLQLVNMLAHQLDGTVTMDVSQGTRFTISFRKPA